MAKPRGFAAMDPETRMRLAIKGGTEAQRRGTGHRFNSEEGQAANRAKKEKQALRLRCEKNQPQPLHLQQLLSTWHKSSPSTPGGGAADEAHDPSPPP